MFDRGFTLRQLPIERGDKGCLLALDTDGCVTVMNGFRYRVVPTIKRPRRANDNAGRDDDAEDVSVGE